MARVIHLAECEPEKHPGWAKTTASEARSDGTELCPQTQYMADELFPDEEVWVEDRPADLTEQARRLALGKVAYEEFASRRVALGQAMPPWQAGPGFGGVATSELPEREREIWAQVAEAVAAAIPFVITDEVCEGITDHIDGEQLPVRVRKGLRAAALAAGFRVEER